MRWWIVNPWQTLMMTEEVLLGYVSVWALPQCHEPRRRNRRLNGKKRKKRAFFKAPLFTKKKRALFKTLKKTRFFEKSGKKTRFLGKKRLGRAGRGLKTRFWFFFCHFVFSLCGAAKEGVCGGYQVFLRCAKARQGIHPQSLKIFVVEHAQTSTGWIFEIFIHNFQARYVCPSQFVS